MPERLHGVYEFHVACLRPSECKWLSRGMVVQKYGVDKVDFWADMTKAFIRDVDAVPGKVKKYYQYIVQHDD